MKGQLRVNFPHYQLIRAYLKKTEQKMVENIKSLDPLL